MIRRIDQFILTLLVLMAVALVGLWFRSQMVGDRYRWLVLEELPGGAVMLESRVLQLAEGGLNFACERRVNSSPDSAERERRRAQRSLRFIPAGYSHFDDPRYPADAGSENMFFGPLGVHYLHERTVTGSLQREVLTWTIPLWLIIMIPLAYPLVRFVLGIVRREREERILLGLCPRCGVNVRNCPERCPVCGKRSPLPWKSTIAPVPAR